jgi:diguanylate cyclase (GGDEF)-like protein
MQIPSIPEDETTRIETLHSYSILDTLPEDRFDRLTRLAKRLFDVPIALVSLIDSDRQWFKSAVGLEVKETPREISFCGHAILGDDIFEVPDTLLDARFSDNPLVKDTPAIRFYAGCPLVVSNGSKLGTLCLIDQAPKKLTEDDKILLRDLAKMVALEIEAIHMATVDELTGLSNRRGFESSAQHVLNLCERLDKPATMLFFDLNNFKLINDQYGHKEGDLTLKTFGNILRKAVRNSDVIARLGGDEFVVLLANTAPDFAKTVVMRLEAMLEAHNLLAHQGYDISFSIGVETYDSDNHADIGDLMHAADLQMYVHKKKSKAFGD